MSTRRFSFLAAALCAISANFADSNVFNASDAAVFAAEPAEIAATTNADRLQNPRKKLIQLGWDIPTTDYMRRHWEQMDATEPFDGLIYDLAATTADGRRVSSQTLFDGKPWNRADFDAALADLQACQFKRLRHNFIRINFHPGGFDWADDAGWDAASKNAAICAEIARETNGGLSLDFESYGAQIFKFNAKSGRTFAETQALARKRGAQFGGAIVAEYPNVVLLCLWMNSINFYAADSATASPEAALSGAGYGLLPAFIDGLLDAAAPETTFVDGCENGYYMNGVQEYQRAALDMISATGPGARLVSPENRVKYRTQVQAGFGFYLDMYSNPPTSNYYRGPEPGETRFERLAVNLRAAWDAADEYVWVYGEQKRWRPVDDAANDAWAPASEPTSWENALPGLTSLLRELSDPNGALREARDRFAADPNAKNLLANGDFSQVKENGTVAAWDAWRQEKTGGEFRALDGTAGAFGVTDGCYLQATPVEPGERLFIAAKVSTKGGVAATLRARWQDADGKWTAVAQDVVLSPATDATPDADGRVDVFGRVTVPASAAKLSLLLLSHGSDEKGVATFDDVRVYVDPLDPSKAQADAAPTAPETQETAE